MVSCARCCLHTSMRALNLIVNLCGVGMIIYSLWLLKKWQDGVAELPTVASIPRPWFIFTFLGVGIAICLSTLSGHMVANCINNSTLCIYIVCICSLFFLEVAVIVTIFFGIDWERELAEYIDAHHTKFKTFVIFHLKMCRLIVIMILVPQINVIMFAVTLWAIGTEPRVHCSYSVVPDFNQSFLVRPDSPILEDLRQACRKCHALLRETPSQSFWSYVKSVLRL